LKIGSRAAGTLTLAGRAELPARNGLNQDEMTIENAATETAQGVLEQASDLKNNELLAGRFVLAHPAGSEIEHAGVSIKYSTIVRPARAVLIDRGGFIPTICAVKSICPTSKPPG